MCPERIVLGARVSREKVARAKALRKAMTLQEKRVWNRLRARRLGGLHFRRQQIIAGFIVDFYCQAASLAIEIDGPIHETQRGYDRERDDCLRAIGVQVIRFQNEDVDLRISPVLNAILAACQVATKPKA